MHLHPKHVLAATTTTLALLAGVGSAHARSHGYRRDIPAGPIALLGYVVPANVPLSVETLNLVSNSLTTPGWSPDTVVDVVEGEDSVVRWEGSNDDCVGLASCVTVPAVPRVRSVIIIVRALSEERGGRADVHVSWPGFSDTNQVFFSGTGFFFVTPPIEAHTIQQNGSFSEESQPGATSTVLLFVDGSAVQALNLQAAPNIPMSTVQAPTCTSGSCYIVVGDYISAGAATEPPVGRTTLLWDAPSWARVDSDNDSLSDALETFDLHTQPNNADTDGDGLDDDVEVLGIRTHNKLRFPFMGADPNKPDVFVEVDATTGNGWTATNAELLVRVFRVNGFKKVLDANGKKVDPPITAIIPDPRDIYVHADIGQTNTDPSTRLLWNNWGGVNTVPDDASHCTGLTPERNQLTVGSTVIRTFHHLLDNAVGGGNTNGGRCSLGNKDLTSMPHELGHQLDLNHGGSPALPNENHINGNQLYPSIMNYSWYKPPEGDDPAFSTKRFGSLKLNPVSLPEKNWTSANIAHLRAWTNVNGTSVDWNMDGLFSDTPVRGQVNMGQEMGHACSEWLFNADAPTTNIQDPAMAWRGNTMFLLARELSPTTSPRILYRTTSTINNCASFRASPATFCAGLDPWAVVPGTTGVSAAFGLTRYRVSATKENLMLVFRKTTVKPPPSSNIEALDYTIWDSATGTWSPVKSVPSGIGIRGSVNVAVSPTNDKQVRVYGIVSVSAGKQLHRWVYQGDTDTWSQTRSPERYVGSSGSPVLVSDKGVVPIDAYLTNSGNLQEIMALVLPAGGVRIARFIESSSDATRLQRWENLNIDRPQPVSGRPGFAYLPFDPVADKKLGQFFLAYAPGPAGFNPQIVRTAGNNPSSATGARVLNWMLPNQTFWTDYDIVQGSFALSFDLTSDTNMRGAFGDGHPIRPLHPLMFAPIADGRINMPFSDWEDWSIMKAALRTSLAR
jgi:hypothetical protein